MKRRILSLLLIIAFASIQSAMLFHNIEHTFSNKIVSYDKSDISYNSENQNNNEDQAFCQKCKIFEEISTFGTPCIINVNIKTDKLALKTVSLKIPNINNIINNYLSRAPPLA